MRKKNLNYDSLSKLFDAKMVYRKNQDNLDALYESLRIENEELEAKFLKEIEEENDFGESVYFKNGSFEYSIDRDEESANNSSINNGKNFKFSAQEFFTKSEGPFYYV